MNDIHKSDSTTVEWENDTGIVNTDDLFQNLSSDESDVVDNITVDIGEYCLNFKGLNNC